MDNQKSFREKKLIEILIVIVAVVFLVGSIVFAFVKRTPTPKPASSKVSSTEIPQSVLDSLTAKSTTTLKIPQSVLDSLTASPN